MDNELVVKENQPLTALEVRANVNLIQEIMREVMTEGQHYGKIPGCGDKPTLLKPGAEKLSITFRLRPIIDNDRDIQIEQLPNNHINVRVYCHILSATGLELATGIGSCSSMESKFRYRGGEKVGTGQPIPKEYWNLKKAGKTREAQESIGGAGFGVGKIDGVWQICEIGEKMENPDISDVHNTVLKMGKKRAYVDGILSATAASDIFTQDIEDLEEEKPENEISVKTKPTTTTPQEKPKAMYENPPEKKAPTFTEKDFMLKDNILRPLNLISEAQSKRLYAIAKGNGYTNEDIRTYLINNYRIEHTMDIEKENYNDIVSYFEIRKDVE